MFNSMLLLAKNSPVNENKSFSTFSFQMLNFLIKAPILDFSVKTLVLSPWRDKLSSFNFSNKSATQHNFNSQLSLRRWWTKSEFFFF